MDARLARDTPKFMVRLPEDAKRWIAAEARRNSSSQNSEVVRSIRERMDRQGASALGSGVENERA
jgi:predicted HicB family RNase H-like nuclease